MSMTETGMPAREGWRLARAVEAPAAVAGRLIEHLRRRHERRRATAGLLLMGDRMLRDVGLTRADVETIWR
jgi:uncharacterized protein YjiS (DUF1127 family)